MSSATGAVPGKTEAASRRKGGYHHNDLRNAVLAEAIALIELRNGPHFSLREIAVSLNVSHSSVYRHFADKADLLDVLTAEGFRILRAYQIEEVRKQGDDPLRQMHALCIAYIRFSRERIGLFRLLFDDRPEPVSNASGHKAFDAEAFDALITLIGRCQKDGLLIDGDPGRIAGYLILAPHGLASYLSQPHAPGREPDRPIELMPAEDLAEIALIPLLKVRPTPEEVSTRYFRT